VLVEKLTFIAHLPVSILGWKHLVSNVM